MDEKHGAHGQMVYVGMAVRPQVRMHLADYRPGIG